jgi:two-component system, OmpR family, response regulator
MIAPLPPAPKQQIISDSPATVVVVDDHPVIREILRLGFEQESYCVVEAESREALFELLETVPCHLITLDLGLGDTDGLTLAREIRSKLNVPIIMITGRAEPWDRVIGLEHGADDYVTKPFHIREIILRARTVLDRYAPAPKFQMQTASQRFAFNGFILDTLAGEMRRATGGSVEMTETEFKLIEILVRNPFRIFTRDELWGALRGRDWSPLDRTLDSHMARLRRKIESDEAPRMIKSIRGVGYMFTAQVREVEPAHTRS